jgi:transglutaminase-like putative cysteine protease
MTLSKAAEIFVGMPRGEEQGPETVLVAFLRRFSPVEGWLTYLVLLISLLVVTGSVNQADWVQTPSLAGIMLWSTLGGLALSKLRLHGVALIVVGLIIGGLVVYWQASTLVESGSFFERLGEMNRRLVVWWDAVVSGGISTDLLPFGLMLAAFTWITGFAATWSVFRLRNVWGAILPGAVGLVANLSYLPDRFSAFLFLYLFFAALLMVRMHALDRQKRWERQSTGFPNTLGWFTLWDGVVLALVVFLIAVLLPARPAVSEALRDFWNQSRAPMDSVETEFNRLFSQVPSRKENPLAQYGQHLPFQGPLHQTDTPVLYIKSDLPTYWRIRTYSTYSAGGWLGEKTERHPLPWIPPLANPAENRSRIELPQQVTPAYPIVQLAMGSTPLQSASPAVIEVLPTQLHTLNVKDGAGAQNLPPDLRKALADLRSIPGQLDRDQLSQRLLQLLPDSVLITQLVLEDAGGGKQERVSVKVPSEEQYPAELRKAIPRNRTFRLTSLQVQRKQPYPPDVVSVFSKTQIKAGQSYTATSWISVASADELNGASPAYPGWVLDRYLQLPPTVPDRVRRLAQQVTRSAATSFEMASALEEHLHDSLSYNTEIPAPPPAADGVDYFLFTAKKGYSDYYASAMVVMSRAVGLPARLVVGFAPGRFDEPTGLFVVRDADSHAWAEVYFPGYGWIEFEPTPGKGSIPRGLPLPVDADTATGSTEDPFGEGSELPFDAENQPSPEDAARGAGAPGWLPYVLGVSTLLAVVLATAAVFWYWYRRTFVHIPAAALVYDRMARLGSLVGMKPHEQQTPQEYARTIGSQFPAIRDDARLIASTYSGSRYGGQALSTDETARTLAAWRRIRARLTRRLYRR